MKWRDRYEGNFLKWDDLPEGESVVLTITSLTEPGTEKDAKGKSIDLGILGFKEHKKRLIVGKTNYRILKILLGQDGREWVGKQVPLQRRYLPASFGFGQNNCPCVRVCPPVGTPLSRDMIDRLGRAEPTYGSDKPKTR